MSKKLYIKVQIIKKKNKKILKLQKKQTIEKLKQLLMFVQ